MTHYLEYAQTFARIEDIHMPPAIVQPHANDQLDEEDWIDMVFRPVLGWLAGFDTAGDA